MKTGLSYLPVQSLQFFCYWGTMFWNFRPQFAKKDCENGGSCFEIIGTHLKNKVTV